jgi:hypothetical protein
MHNGVRISLIISLQISESVEIGGIANQYFLSKEKTR